MLLSFKLSYLHFLCTSKPYENDKKNNLEHVVKKSPSLSTQSPSAEIEKQIFLMGIIKLSHVWQMTVSEYSSDSNEDELIEGCW